MSANISPTDERYQIERHAAEVVVALKDNWNISQGVLTEEDIRTTINFEGIKSVKVIADNLKKYDSSLIIFLVNLKKYCDAEEIKFNAADLATKVRKLLEISCCSQQHMVPQTIEKYGFISGTGVKALKVLEGLVLSLSFIGEVSVAAVKFIKSGTGFRRTDFLIMLERAGARALPIVSLVSFLIGLIIAFIGSIQLKQFGANIYVADLVAIGMTRELSAMMTAIIMAGRTGAAFAAEIGSMQVNDEIDALKTFAISPVMFLVLPRLFAFILMMPLLAIFANVMGITGGAVVGIFTLDLSVAQYYQQTINALSFSDLLVGFSKAVCYAILVAMAGCWQGIHCGRSSEAVGKATTMAVSLAIVLIIIASALLNIFYNILEI